MSKGLKALAAAIGVCAVMSGTATAEPCRPDSVFGLFEGAGNTPHGNFEITLNLLCHEKTYVAQLSTSIGDLPVRSATSSRNSVHVEFEAGGAGILDLALRGERLAGTSSMGGGKGEIDLTRKGPPLSINALQGRLDLTTDEWRADITALGRELPKRHANAFFYISREKFEAEIDRLSEGVAALNGDEIFVRLAQIVNSIGDGHTIIVTPPDRAQMPIELEMFGSDIRVTGAGPGLETANGARVMAIADTPIGKARRLALTLTPPGELMELRDGRIVFYLSRGIVLHGLGITPDRSTAHFALRADDGKAFAVDIAAPQGGSVPRLEPAYPKTSLRYQKADEPFWCTAIADRSAVYCAWHAYPNLAANSKAMFDLIESSHATKLVIDMRDNEGGDNTEGDAHIVKPLAARGDINRKGRLFVLIGPLTFSAAMNNAAQLQDETNAILVGQTIGERPNSYQEPRQFRLPNSHLIVRVSTLYYEFRKTGENAVRPDKDIIPTWADAKAGRDPALDWALSR